MFSQNNPMFASLQQQQQQQQPEAEHCDSESEGPSFELRGVCERLETSSQTVFVWNLSAENLNDYEACIEIVLDIRSYQKNVGFTSGPGIFALAPPQGPEYAFATPTSVEGTTNASYAGAGWFFKSHALPPGTSTFIVSATFDSSNPLLEQMQMRDSVFSVNPDGANNKGDVQSETIFVQCFEIEQCNSNCCDCLCTASTCCFDCDC